MKSNLQITYSPHRKKFPGRLRLFTGMAIACCITCVQPAMALAANKIPKEIASVHINGQVTDDRGAVLPGVSVSLKGTGTGAITDRNGDFSITVPDASSGMLVFSYLGYISQEVALKGQTNIKVSLQVDSKSLNEVVVVGYGTQKKATLTGSISVIKGADMVKSPEPDLSNSFAGRVSGVIANNVSGEPGYDGSSILIRGLATTGSNNVLVVVDGVPGQIGGLERLDPNDIESVSVLKDGTAAIYGSRAANGVILITTKHGKTGKATVTYSFNQGFDSPTRLPKMADAATYAQIVNDISYYDSPTNGMNQVYSAAQIQKFKDGSDPVNYPNTDWEKLTLKSVALQNQNSLTVSGGNDDVKYFTSVGTVYQDGLYKDGATNYHQYNVRSNLDANVAKGFKIGLSLSGREEDRQYPTTSAASIFRGIYRSYPTSAGFYPNGLPTTGIDQVNPALVGTSIGGTNQNPTLTFNGILKASYDIPGVEGLSIDGFFSADKSGTSSKVFSVPYTVYSYNSTTNIYTPSIEGGGPNGLASLFQSQLNQSLITSNIKLNYARKFGKHDVNAFVGYEQSKTTYSYFWAQKNDFPTATTPELSEGGTAASDATNGGSSSDNNGNFDYNRKSVISRLAYNYDEKYLLEGQFRADGSSLFAPGHQWGYFPSVSAGYRISKEDWFSKTISFINDLKIRASYGVLGDDLVGPYQYFDNFSFSNYVVTDNGSGAAVQPGINLTKLANPNITWETAKKTDIGINATFLNNFTLEAIYFRQVRSNILGYKNGSIPATSGIVNPYNGDIVPAENIDKVNSNGFEGTLGYNHPGKFSWGVSGNFTYAKSKIVYIDEASGTLPYQSQIGGPLNNYLLYNAIGIFRSQAQLNSIPHVPGAQVGDLIYEDYNHDGKITAADQTRTKYGNIPQIVYGFTVNAAYKSFDLSILFSGQAEVSQYVLPESGTIGNYYSSWANNAWSPTNPNGTYPRVSDRASDAVSGGSFPSTFWLNNAAFLRLKNTQLGYTLPQSVISKLHIASLRLFVGGFNLLTFTKVKDYDPEGTSGSGQFYPEQKIINVGVNVKL
ncbi:TonB-linked outer membrane protein, SusC/RagA family [Mucilaginibacter mallensis]|uniref:TonB-linked outer membrane protein, SusC/RagA family n=1 Tax=Mucilaginibacter mallensis TaxID=652787 RepID=A0A1H1Y331_MUCMA|nr:TonB-dependent receptor [Mucilaginibacter mallensis]SDT15659.1 TonB-linked outer membrane protein, SusC/RagA family [Mucilaginibacter mallensis]